MRRRLFSNNDTVKTCYGDGSLNTVTDGYDSKLVYCKGNVIQRIEPDMSLPYSYGNFHGTGALHGDTSGLEFNSQFRGGTSGTNSMAVNINAESEPVFVYAVMSYGALTTQIYVKDLYFTADGEKCSLKQMVDSRIIEPLVVCPQAWGTNAYLWQRALSLYDNSSATDTRDYCGASFAFTLKKGHRISEVSYWASKARGSTRYDDGLTVKYIPASQFEYRLLK